MVLPYHLFGELIDVWNTSSSQVQYLGTHCENSLKDSCQTIVGGASTVFLSCNFRLFYFSPYSYLFIVERENETFSVSMFKKELFQEYSRPVYSHYYEGNPGIADDAHLLLIYTGNRWFGSYFPVKDVANLTSEYVEAWWSNYHGEFSMLYCVVKILEYHMTECFSFCFL